MNKVFGSVQICVRRKSVNIYEAASAEAPGQWIDQLIFTADCKP